jgi:hypothetical protein
MPMVEGFVRGRLLETADGGFSRKVLRIRADSGAVCGKLDFSGLYWAKRSDVKSHFVTVGFDYVGFVTLNLQGFESWSNFFHEKFRLELRHENA